MARYQQDPNDSTKQVPSSPFRSAYQNVTTTTLPAEAIVQKRPSSIIIGKDGTYAFLYQTTASVGNSSTLPDFSKYITGSKLHDPDQGPVELPIQPVAWRLTDEGSNGAVGDITFIYRGGA